MKIKYLDLQAINDSYGQPLLDAVNGVVKSGWYLHGCETEAFEAEWGDYCGARYSVGVGNGLDGLKLVLQAMKIMYGWADGDEVIVPANTFIATALAISQVDLRPTFCEVNQDDALICCDEIYLQGLVNERTRCIIPVHLYGQTANLQKIYEFASKHKLQVLEDACQAHGAKCSYKGQRTCVYSFYPGKNLGALGDGGCVTTDNQEVAKLVRNLANYGQNIKYVHDYQGFNSRLDEIQAAVLRVKLRRLDADNKRRMEIAGFYQDNLPGNEKYEQNTQLTDVRSEKIANQLDLKNDGTNVFHIYPYITNSRKDMQKYLFENGIETQVHYPIPCHKQKAYSMYGNVFLPNVEYLAAHELSLPNSQILTDEQVNYIVKTIVRYFDLNEDYVK